ncbi:hypothetical protein C8Q76DRAFT_757223, partial [Earliella scabrosa]
MAKSSPRLSILLFGLLKPGVDCVFARLRKQICASSLMGELLHASTCLRVLTRDNHCISDSSHVCQTLCYRLTTTPCVVSL